jgi:hypothetical protein
MSNDALATRRRVARRRLGSESHAARTSCKDKGPGVHLCLTPGPYCDEVTLQVRFTWRVGLAHKDLEQDVRSRRWLWSALGSSGRFECEPQSRKYGIARIE